MPLFSMEHNPDSISVQALAEAFHNGQQEINCRHSSEMQRGTKIIANCCGIPFFADFQSVHYCLLKPTRKLTRLIKG